MPCPTLPIDDFAGPLRVAHLAAVFQHAESDAAGTSGLRVHMCEIGNVDRRLLLDDAPPRLGARPGVALDRVDALDDRPHLLRHDLENLAGLALAAAGQDDHLVALADFRRHHSTSGASDTIFM